MEVVQVTGAVCAQPVLVARKPVEDVAPVTKPEIAPLLLARDPGANWRGDVYTGTGISC
jgi:hypothetical protein